MTLEKVEFDLREVIEGIVSLVELKIEEKGLKLSIDYDKNLDNIYYGDPHRYSTQIYYKLIG